jgi:hypothetical protein
MSLTKVVRGTLATTRVRFYTSAGQPGVPPSAAIRLVFKDLDGVAAMVEDSMTLDGSIYKYPFNTSVCSPCVVSGHIDATVPVGEPVGVDFSFEVTANPANL